MGLSFQWRTILNKLSEYGDDGIKVESLRELLGGGELVRNDPVKSALSQMFFLNVGYYERHPNDGEKIRITEAGREVLCDER